MSFLFIDIQKACSSIFLGPLSIAVQASSSKIKYKFDSEYRYNHEILLIFSYKNVEFVKTFEMLMPVPKYSVYRIESAIIHWPH